MLLAATQWSEAIWAEAKIAGPLHLSQNEIARGLAIAHHPIHVCGVHRSGTTLVRDLLDSHPALAVLPSEGTFFTNFKGHLRRLPPESWQRHLGCDWLRRLANPIHQAPYWLLGRSTEEMSPYLEFARSLMAWWPLARENLGNRASSWPLTAVGLAYAHCTGGLQTRARTQFWAEKTPTNERFIDCLRTEMPGAMVIHVIRHPYAVFASHKQAMRDAGERFSSKTPCDRRRSAPQAGTPRGYLRQLIADQSSRIANQSRYPFLVKFCEHSLPFLVNCRNETAWLVFGREGAVAGCWGSRCRRLQQYRQSLNPKKRGQTAN